MKQLIDIIQEKLKISNNTKFDLPQQKYFYFEALEDNFKISFIDFTNILQYSIDECKTWNELITETPEINKGKHIYFKCNNPKCRQGIGKFGSANREFNVGGNIMSLIYGDDFGNKTELLNDEQFRELLIDNTYLISAENLVLPATKLTKYCYMDLFCHCVNLEKGPKILPATKLSYYCYCNMFAETNITETPELYGDKLAYGCYICMFFKCKSLIKTTQLKSDKLDEKCYSAMFGHCESLKEAPELPAKILVEGCYDNMFYGCKSLEKITMLATDISARNCLAGFTNSYFYKKGEFIKSKGVIIPNGSSGIPDGWTVKEI